MAFGGGSIQIARIFGIRIGVTASWLVVLFIAIFTLSTSFRDVLGGSTTQAYVVAVAAALLFYVSLVLHELGHALVARRFGIGVERIDLWMFGGVAVLDGDPPSPGREFAVAIAGPIVTALVAGACAAVGVLIDTPSRFGDLLVLHLVTPPPSPALLLLSFVCTMNAVLLLFNLVPAFPLDGGRILLAAGWKLSGSRATGTRWAGRAGLGFAYALGAYAVYVLLNGDSANGIWFGVLAWFLASGARAAVVRGTLDHRLSVVTVADVMDPSPLALPADTTLLAAHDQVFETGDWPFVAVTEPDGRFAGVLRRDVVEAELAAGRPALAVREALDDGAEGWRVGTDQPLEALLAAESLRRIGAVFAVDGQGILRGVVTMDALRRALSPATGR